MAVQIRIFQALIFVLSLLFAPRAFADEGTIANCDRNTAELAEGAESNDEEWRKHLAKGEQDEEEARHNSDSDDEPDEEKMEEARHEKLLAHQYRAQAREFALDALKSLVTRNSMVTQSTPPATMKDGSPIDVMKLQRIANLPVTGNVDASYTSLGRASFTNGRGRQPASISAADLNPASVSTPGIPSVKTKTGTQSETSISGTGSYGGSGMQLRGGQFDSAPNALSTITSPSSQAESKSAKINTDSADSPSFKTNTIEALKSLKANRARVMKQMGMRGPASVEEVGPIRAKSEDIFEVLHMHYSSLSERGIFYKDGEKLPPTPGPSSMPPAFSRGL